MGSQFRKEETADRHILICLSSSTSNARVIHAAAKIAAAFQGTLTALFVETPAYSLMPDDDRKRLRSNMNLAEKLGAKLDTVIGDDVPYQIAEYARVSDISCVVIGQTNTAGGLLRRKKSLSDRLVAYAPDLDYFIIPDHGTKAYAPRKPSGFNRKRLILDCAVLLSDGGSYRRPIYTRARELLDSLDGSNLLDVPGRHWSEEICAASGSTRGALRAIERQIPKVPASSARASRARSARRFARRC